jgi:hypothetical protein
MTDDTNNTRDENFNSSGHSSIPLLLSVVLHVHVFLLIFAAAASAAVAGVQRARRGALSLWAAANGLTALFLAQHPVLSAAHVMQSSGRPASAAESAA